MEEILSHKEVLPAGLGVRDSLRLEAGVCRARCSRACLSVKPPLQVCASTATTSTRRSRPLRRS
jgi:hypothetical protein